jgi:16S rRNA (guanine966-N2)-methyltransferase
MKLRIISGLLKGRFISVSDKGEFRPTSERTRESLSQIIQPYLDNARIADICAGSGAFGFEMISRGAVHADFVELDRMRAAAIRKNAGELGIEDKCTVINNDVNYFLEKTSGSYDLIFFDPPYDDQTLKNLVSRLCERLNPDGILLYESRKMRRTDTTYSLTPDNQPFEIRTFGDTMVSFFKNPAIKSAQ